MQPARTPCSSETLDSFSFFSRYQKFTPNSSFPGANFNEFCIVFLHFFSLSSLFFLLFTKTSSAHSFLTVFAEHSMSDDDVKEKFFSPCRQRRRKRRKILKASVNNTQVRCKSNVLQVVFLYFSVVQPQGVGVGFFSGGCEREKRKIGRFSFTFTISLWVLVTEQ